MRFTLSDMAPGRRVERRLRERDIDPDDVRARVEAVFAAVQRARAEERPDLAREFLAPRVADLPDIGLWLETLPVEVWTSGKGDTYHRREFAREQLRFDEAVLQRVRMKKLDTAANGAPALVVSLDWNLPVELRKRREIRVRERWQLELANGEWMLAGFEVHGGYAGSAATKGEGG